MEKKEDRINSLTDTRKQYLIIGDVISGSRNSIKLLIAFALLASCNAIEDLIDDQNEESENSGQTEEQIPEEQHLSLPNELNLSFTESHPELQSGHQYELIELLKQTYQNDVEESLYTISEEEDIYTTAYVETRPLKDIRFGLYEDSDDEMLKIMRDSVDHQFENKISVIIMARSYDINAMSLGDEDAFELMLEYGGEQISPRQVRSGRIKKRFSAGMLWYQRKVRVDFPRNSGGTDLWNDNSVTVTLRPIREEIRSSENEYYEFHLTAGEVR